MLARKMIQDLEETLETEDNNEIKSLITDLGLKYSLASKHTSFVAVDDQSNKESGVMITRQVKNQVARGYGGMYATCAKRLSAPSPGAMRSSAPSMNCQVDGDSDPDSCKVKTLTGKTINIPLQFDGTIAGMKQAIQ